jgi:hypothetical protein
LLLTLTFRDLEFRLSGHVGHPFARKPRSGR